MAALSMEYLGLCALYDILNWCAQEPEKVLVGTVVKVVRFAPADKPPTGLWLQHSASIQTEHYYVSFSASVMPRSCLERPKVRGANAALRGWLTCSCVTSKKTLTCWEAD